LQSSIDEQLVAAMEGVVRDERGLRFEREEND
jgi:cyanophycin synthetase